MFASSCKRVTNQSAVHTALRYVKSTMTRTVLKSSTFTAKLQPHKQINLILCTDEFMPIISQNQPRNCGLSQTRFFYARKQLLLSARLSYCNSVRLSVCPSVTGGSVKNGAS